MMKLSAPSPPSFPYRSAGKGAPYWGSNHREGSAIAELEAPFSLSCRPKYPWRASVAPFPPRYASAALSTVCPPGTTIKVIKVWTRLYNRSVRPSFFSGPAFLYYSFCPTTSSGPPSFSAPSASLRGSYGASPDLVFCRLWRLRCVAYIRVILMKFRKELSFSDALYFFASRSDDGFVEFS